MISLVEEIAILDCVEQFLWKIRKNNIRYFSVPIL
jgi:hypothetical protein